MRNLILALTTAFLFASSPAQAKNCAAFDAIADLMREAREAQVKTKWRADGDWKIWESKVKKELQSAGYERDVDSISKNLRRSIQKEQKLASSSATGTALKSEKSLPTFPTTHQAEKNLAKLQKGNQTVFDSYQKWVNRVKTEGLENVRKTPGYHDEPLHFAPAGSEAGSARSVRLNQQYRVLYELDKSGQVRVLDVTPHDYRVK